MEDMLESDWLPNKVMKVPEVYSLLMSIII